MAVICPTITAMSAQEFREQMARVAPFAKRVHIDLSDGEFSPVKLINPIQAYWPEGMVADLHLMFERPNEHLETAISLKPDLVIIHAEAEGDLLGMLRQLRAVGIKTGLALLQQTQPTDQRLLISEVDHVLLFSGTLGHFGGVADLGLLSKVGQIKGINATAEIGWDGGINTENAPQLTVSGVDVLDVGGGIHKAPDPKQAYAELTKALEVINHGSEKQSE